MRDIAQAHVLALLKPAAAGNRFICTARSFKWQDFGTSRFRTDNHEARLTSGIIVSAAHKVIDSIPAGNMSYDPSQAKQVLTYDNRKAIAILGIKFRSLEETAKDTVEDFKVRGWL